MSNNTLTTTADGIIDAPPTDAMPKPARAGIGLFGLNIAPRLILLVAIPAVLMAAGFLLGGLTASTSLDDLGDINQEMRTAFAGNQILTDIDAGVVNVVHGVNDGVLTWQDGLTAIAAARSTHEEHLAALNALLGDNPLKARIGTAAQGFQTAMDEAERLFKAENPAYLRLFVVNDLPPLTDPYRGAIDALSANGVRRAESAYTGANDRIGTASWVLTLGGILGLAITLALGWWVYRSVIGPIDKMSTTVDRVSGGDLQARARIVGEDELARLGRAFDDLLDERVAAQRGAEQEAEQLNDSIIALMLAVSRLSDRDLTVTVPVGEDVTGPLSDAMNQLAGDTATVLRQVVEIARTVDSSSTDVQGQAENVARLASRQAAESQQTAEQLERTTSDLTMMAESAGIADRTAITTEQATRATVDAVQGALRGMEEIRGTVQDTGKRIKRLAERAQEISGIVDLINNISERTTVLALNASMQAAAAGEAGRGFAVVADEVQRLAESSRQATGQIATLVKNIQVETNDAISTMDTTIHQVVEGTQLANEASRQMQITQDSTDELVATVRGIAESSRDQVQVASTLREQAQEILEQTTAMTDEVDAQLVKASDLRELSQRLMSSVSVFKLDA